MSGDKPVVQMSVLGTSAQSTRREDLAGTPPEWTRSGEMHGVARSRSNARGNLTAVMDLDAPSALPDVGLLLQAAVTLGEKNSEGHLIEAVAIPWLALLAHIKGNPRSMHEIDWRKWEEIIAGAYRDSGYVVTLTNRSGDKGRDVIATKPGSLSVRYFDQVKAYTPGNPVTLDQVHSMLGVLSAQPNVSKGIITTTSDFAPGVYTDPEVQRFMPYRLDLRPRDKLLQWLGEVGRINV